MELIHPNCVICGRPWSSLEDEHLRPHMTMWCCGENGQHDDCTKTPNHDTIWYYQDQDGICSFDLEVNDLHGEYYWVRWNCQCMNEECLGKNCIILDEGDYFSESEIIKYFDPPLPYTISREELYKLITG